MATIMSYVSSSRTRARWAAVAFLLACSPPPAAPLVPTTSSGVPPGASSALTPGAAKPQFGRWGFDLDGMDRSVAPGVSFHGYASGHWLATTPIPPDKSNYGLFTALSDLSDDRTREIIESSSGAPGSEERKISDLYRSFLDEAAIEAKGLAPLQSRLHEIASIKGKAGVVHEFARLARELG